MYVDPFMAGLALGGCAGTLLTLAALVLISVIITRRKRAAQQRACQKLAADFKRAGEQVAQSLAEGLAGRAGSNG